MTTPTTTDDYERRLVIALRALVRVVRTQLDAEHYVAGVAERVMDGTATEEEVKGLEETA